MLVRKMYEYEYAEIIKLIQETIHSVCQEDYSARELDAWAPQKFDEIRFINSLNGCCNYVCTDKRKIVGFVSIEENGYINRLFVHKDYQRQKIGSCLLCCAEKWAYTNGVRTISLDSSKTAEGFYMRHGYLPAGISVINRNGVVFKNVVMKKILK